METNRKAVWRNWNLARWSTLTDFELRKFIGQWLHAKVHCSQVYSCCQQGTSSVSRAIRKFCLVPYSAKLWGGTFLKLQSWQIHALNYVFAINVHYNNSKKAFTNVCGVSGGLRKKQEKKSNSDLQNGNGSVVHGGLWGFSVSSNVKCDWIGDDITQTDLIQERQSV